MTTTKAFTAPGDVLIDHCRGTALALTAEGAQWLGAQGVTPGALISHTDHLARRAERDGCRLLQHHVCGVAAAARRGRR